VDACVVRVCVDTIAPCRAQIGDRLVLWPGHPTHAVTVYDAHGRPLRHRGMDAAELRGVIARLLSSGVLVPLTPTDAQQLRSAG
jgi:hypothetical protein